MNRVVLGVLSLGLAALLGVGCGGESSSEESGESHFLAYCESTCAEGLSCLCGVCTAPCTASDECPSAGECVPGSCPAASSACDRFCSSDQECSPLGDGYRCEEGACRLGNPPQSGAGGGPPVTPGECGEGCQRVTVYPEMPPAEGCVEVYLLGVEACACGTPEVGRKCAKFEPGKFEPSGDLYRVPVGVEFPGVNVSECTEEEESRVLHVCEVAQCEVPPPSACSVEDTCAALGCGGLEFDSDGCRRPECETDAECSEEERCVKTSVTAAFCDYSPDGQVCNCSGPSIGLQASLCNPVSVVGPRGTWEKLEFLEVGDECVEDCEVAWVVTPDGTRERTDGDGTEVSELTEAELEMLNEFVDGAELRPGLRDGFACEPVFDYGLTVRLTLSGQTLEQEATGCLFVEGHVVQQLGAIVMKE